MIARTYEPEFDKSDTTLSHAEVMVNVPVRRGFGRNAPPPIELPGFGEEVHQLTGGGSAYQTFHYHIPPDLSGRLQPGHLVWVPFGRQEVQGIVSSLASSAPVETRPIARLARPAPVLTPLQIELAFWIADYYVAPLSAAVKLFLPPGLLRKQGEKARARARHEEQIELLIDAESIDSALLNLGRRSKQVVVIETLLASGRGSLEKKDVRKQCSLRSDSTLRTLAEKGIISLDGDRVSLVPDGEEARDILLDLRGARRYAPILETLADAGGPLWKSELYERVDTDRAGLTHLQKAGLIRLENMVRYRDPLAGSTYARTHPPRFTDQQARVWSQIEEAVFADAHRIRAERFLLHGVTGSGKTEIYLRAIAETLARGRQAIVLVPEIALTPQTVARFAGRFPGRVSVIHSELSAGERYDVWRRIREGAVDIVVGPRSALFAPLERLGLIVIDEEHESSYKQDAEEWGSFTVFYDARRVARQMARQSGSALILGSATPSLESYHNAESGEFRLLEMTSRVMGHGAPAESGDEKTVESEQIEVVGYSEMPPVEIVDMRQELRAGNRSIFSRSLQAELHATLDAHEQAILFLNRRGTHTFVLCRDCGYVCECSRCDVPLTYHERASRLVCHHCGKGEPIPEICPECESRRIKYFGSGTQRIEELVRQISPRARILRWDADTTGRKGSHSAILERFAAHEADVLVGTQMIAKGLDLPLVTLVGVVSADVGLYLPDFRSAERTFQLLTQVAGRAGRSARGGRVIFQSYTPEHYSVQAAAEHDYESFYRRALAFREEQGYPPVGRLARLVFWHKKFEVAEETARQMAGVLMRRAASMGHLGETISIQGPAPAFFSRYRGFYRWQLLVRGADPSVFLSGLDIPFGWRIDIDSQSLL